MLFGCSIIKRNEQYLTLRVFREINFRKQAYTVVRISHITTTRTKQNQRF